MVGDEEYMNFIEDVIPGHSDEFYYNMSYAGTIGSPVYDDLNTDKKDELEAFFIKNKIYNK